MSTGPDAAIYTRPAELLQALIRFDTTNPPGNEAACVGYVNDLLTAAGIPTTILARDPARPNLVARLRGQGNAPPLLLQGHLDVVTTAHQQWQHPPFGGEIVDGAVWGRGTLDMKGGIAMMLAAMLRAQAEGAPLPGDILLALVSDEEASSAYGARFLVEEHPALFTGVRYALGEFGGFSLYLGGRRFYPIMVAEKQICGVRLTVRGPGGHAAFPLRGGAMARLGRVLARLDAARLPAHLTPVVGAMIETVAGALPPPVGPALLGLLDPARADAVLDALGPQGALFDPLLHNMVNATIVQGGEQVNVIPSKVDVVLDGRVLPGYGAADMRAELHELLGDEVEIAITLDETHPVTPDLSLFPVLAGVLREADPDGIPMPYMLAAVTDGRHFARLGIQCYGFLPMQLPPDFQFQTTIHAADERIPVDAVNWGTAAMFAALQRVGAA